MLTMIERVKLDLKLEGRELRSLIAAQTLSIDQLLARVAVLEKNGDPEEADTGPPAKKARIPARPVIMQDRNVGKDPR